MSTMVTPGRLPLDVLTQADACDGCETDRRPRMFICTYHEGWWDGWEHAQSVRPEPTEPNRTNGDHAPPIERARRRVADLAPFEDKREHPTPTACICPRFRDTGGYRIADLCCPVHGVNGTDPGDGYWPDEAAPSGTSGGPDD